LAGAIECFHVILDPDIHGPLGGNRYAAYGCGTGNFTDESAVAIQYGHGIRRSDVHPIIRANGNAARIRSAALEPGDLFVMNKLGIRVLQSFYIKGEGIRVPPGTGGAQP